MNTPDQSNPSEPNPQKKKLRSPSYPSLNLCEAVKLAKLLWDQEKRHPAPVPIVVVHWNFGAKSSTGLLAVAALKKFGLLIEEGSGAMRTVKLSDFALDIIKHEESPDELGKLLKIAALKPEIHRDLWENHRDASDANIKRFLIFDKKFNNAVVDSVIKEYRDTIEFAKMGSDDTISETNAEHDANKNQKPIPSKGTVPVVGLAAQQHPKNLFTVGKSGVESGQRRQPPMIDTLRYLPIPLDIGDAPIPVGMSESDFTLLIDTLTLWKKKIVKPEFPKNAINGSNEEVVIVGFYGTKEGGFYLSEDGTTIPADELTFIP